MKSNVEQTLKNFSKEDVERTIDQSITMWQWVAEHCMQYGYNAKMEYFRQHKDLTFPMKACYLCELIRQAKPDKQYFGIGYPCCAEVCPVKWAPPVHNWGIDTCDASVVSPYYKFIREHGKAQKVAAKQIVTLLQNVKDDLNNITEEKENDA